MRRFLNAKFLIAIFVFFHTCLFLGGFLRGVHPDLYDWILFLANFATMFLVYKGIFSDLELSASAVFLIFAHALFGRIIAPDNLSSGAALVVNLFVVYAGLDLLRRSMHLQWYLFVASYLLLFLIFIVLQQNAEPLFLAAVFGLCGVSKHLRLLAYFWAIVIAFTVCQPYAWESVIIFFVILKILFSAQMESDSVLLRIIFVLGLLVLFVLVLPLLAVVLSEDPRNISKIFVEKRFVSAMLNSFLSASFSTFFLFLIFTPFAYALSRARFRLKDFIISLSDLSIIVPESIAGIALLLFFGHQRPAGELLYDLFQIRFDGTFLGICLAQIFIALPFYFRTVLRAFEAVPSELEFIGETLGASRLEVLFKISFPLAYKGIFLAIVLAFGRAAGVFGAVLLIAPNPETAPILAFNRFQALGMYETTPLVASLLIISFLLFLLLQTVSSKIKSESGASN